MRSLFCYIIIFIIFQAEVIADTITAIPSITVKAHPVHKALNYASTGPVKHTITQQEINNSGLNSLSQVLQDLGGIQIQDASGNGTQSVLSMRGFGANAISNSLVLINGIPLTNPDMSAPNLNIIPLQDIKFIEIISGSETVLYGDQAVGGVVNIATGSKLNEKIQFSCASGSYDQRLCLAEMTNEYKKLIYSLHTQINKTDNYRDHNDYRQNLFSGRISYHGVGEKIIFETALTNEMIQFPGALTAAQVQQNRRQSTNQTDFFRNQSGYYHLKDIYLAQSDWRAETDIVIRETRGNGVLTSPFSQDRVSYFIKPQLKGRIKNSPISSGLDLQFDNYKLTTQFGKTLDRQQQFGIYSLVNLPLSSYITGLLGIRGAQQRSELNSLSAINTTHQAMATTIGLTMKLTPHANLFLRRAESFRFPKADEDAYISAGSHGLKTQRGVSYETGLNINYQKSLTRISLYQLNLHDEITFDPLQTPQNPFGVNANLDRTVRRGLVFFEKYNLTSKLKWGIHYNYVNARFQRGIYAGNRVPLVAENILLANLDYLIDSSWKVYAEALYTGNQYADNDNANITSKIGGYTTYNIGLNYNYKHFTATFRMNNLFNKYYYLYTVYQPNVQTKYFYPASGRNMMLNIKYSFA